MMIEWPQIIWLCLAGLNLLGAIAMDGEPKTGKHSLALSMLGGGASFGLLYWGGFFS